MPPKGEWCLESWKCMTYRQIPIQPANNSFNQSIRREWKEKCSHSVKCTKNSHVLHLQHKALLASVNSIYGGVKFICLIVIQTKGESCLSLTPTLNYRKNPTVSFLAKKEGCNSCQVNPYDFPILF